MTVSTTLIRIILLLLPGLVASRIYRKLRGRTDRRKWEEFSEILIFALASYLLIGVLQFFWKALCPGSGIVAFQTLKGFFGTGSPQVHWWDILVATGLAIPIACAASAVYYYECIHKLGRYVRVSDRTGDEDIWSYYHANIACDWLFIRDHDLGLIYYCNILAYSDSGTTREMILRDVEVFDDSDPVKRLYDTPVMYISRATSRLTFEHVNLDQGSDPESEE